MPRHHQLFSPVAVGSLQESLHSDLANLKVQSPRFDEQLGDDGFSVTFSVIFLRNPSYEVCSVMRYQHVGAILSMKCHRSCNIYIYIRTYIHKDLMCHRCVLYHSNS